MTEDAPEGPTPPRPGPDALDVTLDGVESVTLWVEEAGLLRGTRPGGHERYRSDVTLAGSFGRRETVVPEGDSETTVRLAS